VLNGYVVASAKQSSPMIGQVNRHRVHEGSSSAMHRESGEVEDVEIQKIEAGVELPTNTLLYGPLDDLLKSFREIGRELGAQQEMIMFDTFEQATSKTGNVVNDKGSPLTTDLFFQVLETIEIDFDGNGSPRMPTMVVNPAMAEQIARLQQESDRPDVKARYDALMRKKKMEWRAREADRTLVG